MNNQYKRRVFISSLLLSLACTNSAVSQTMPTAQSAKHTKDHELTGGAGADIFSVGNWSTVTPEHIDDFFVGIDKIKISRLGATFADLTIQDSEQGVIISDQARQIAILKEVKAESLKPDSFIFGDPVLAEQLQSALNKAQSESGAPGATEAIVTPDGFTWEGAAGVSNLATQTPMKTDDIFNIASITKAFTAATVLKLAEAEKLSLDDTLAKWVPDIAANIPDGKNITVRQVLNGTSGIADYKFDSKFQADVKADLLSGSTRRFELEELVAYSYGKPRFSGPSSSAEWTYPETGNIVAKLIVEKATGMPFTYVLREQILKPLGLNSTFVSGQEQVVGNQARGYDDYLTANGSIGRDGALDDATNFNPSVSGGDLFSTAQDVARFSAALFGGKILQSNSQKELLAFVNEGIPYEGNQYGLGVVNYESRLIDNVYGKGNFYGKGGATPGYRSNTLYFPERGGSTVSTLVNRYELLGGQLGLQNPPSNPVLPIQRAILNTLLQPGS